MGSNLKKGFITFLAFVFIVTMLSACAMQRTNRLPGQPNVQQQGQNIQRQEFRDGNALNVTPQTEQTRNLLNVPPQTGRDGIMNNNPQTNQPGIVGQMNADTKKAENIKAQVKSMNEVKDASVIVIGNTALVGCKLSGNAGNTADIRNKVIQKVKSTDNTITNCTVSESPQILDRINKLGTDITNNKPVNEISEEFNRIIKTITS